jgi:hypothetical protein
MKNLERASSGRMKAGQGSVSECPVQSVQSPIRHFRDGVSKQNRQSGAMISFQTTSMSSRIDQILAISSAFSAGHAARPWTPSSTVLASMVSRLAASGRKEPPTDRSQKRGRVRLFADLPAEQPCFRLDSVRLEGPRLADFTWVQQR